MSQVDRGMRAALDRNRRPVSVEWNYLGLSSPVGRGVSEATAEARRAIDRFKPDVLIAVDDEANSLVAQHYVGRPEPRILYLSIDQPPASYGYAGAPNATGSPSRCPGRPSGTRSPGCFRPFHPDAGRGSRGSHRPRGADPTAGVRRLGADHDR